MIETKYQDQEIFAPNFKALLVRLYSEKNSDLLNFLINSNRTNFNDKYKSVSCGTLDYEIEIKEEKESEPESKEDIKCNFTPKSKSLFSEGNIYDKKYRMDGSIGSILRSLVEGDSPIVKCRKKIQLGTSKEYVEDLRYGFNVIDSDFYLLNPEVPYTGKISNFEFKVTKFPDSMYEDLVNRIKGFLSNSFKFEIVSGDDIVKYYHEASYDPTNKGGNLWGSCMRHTQCSEYIKFYAKIPECSMLLIKKGKYILGRALIWETNFGKILDRRYIAVDYLENALISYAKKQKWHYKTYNTYSNIAEYMCCNYATGEYSNKNVPLIVRISNKNIKDHKQYPYCDTFSFYHYYDNMLVNYNRASSQYSFTIKNTNGSKCMVQQMNLNSLFRDCTSTGSEKGNVIKEDLSNINEDIDICGYSAEPLCKDWEGRFRLKNLCSFIDNQYVCVFNKDSYERFCASKK